MALKHVIEAQQFDRETIEQLFELAAEMQVVLRHGGSTDLLGKSMVRLFYEPSTRTFLSFGQSMRKLGGSVDGSEHAGSFSSAVKGETLEDSIRAVCELGFDVVVLRHKAEGSAKRASEVSSVPIVNAGDGGDQHPTQALLDLYTIKQRHTTIDGLSVALVGDLKHGRAVRSLAYLLGKFEISRIYFVSGKGMEVHAGILEYLERHNVLFDLTDNLEKIASEVDVIYLTRFQKERVGEKAQELETTFLQTTLTPAVVEKMKKSAVVLHPLPRNSEISPNFDSDPRAAYFDQIRNGLAVRMALLQTILS